MRKLLLPSLVASLVANGFLLWYGGAPAGPVPGIVVSQPADPGSEAPAPAEAPRSPTDPKLEQELAHLRELSRLVAAEHAELAATGDVHSLRALLKSEADLRTKLLAVRDLNDQELAAAFQIVHLHPPSHADVRELLVQERDATVLALLAKLLSWGGVGGVPGSTPSEDLGRMVDLLAHGAPAERRMGVAALLARQSVRDRPAAWADGIVAALRDDADPRVAGLIADGLQAYAGGLPQEIMTALAAAPSHMPPGRPRLDVLRALASRTFADDSGAALIDRWFATSDPDLRDEIARAAGLAAWTAGADSAPRVPDLRTRFLAIYQETRDADSRMALLFGAIHGWRLVPADSREAETLLREVATRESDPERRDRVSRLAERVRGGLDPTSQEAHVLIRAGK